MKKDYDTVDYEYAQQPDPDFTSAKEMFSKIKKAQGR
jgi:hypothetical protein